MGTRYVVALLAIALFTGCDSGGTPVKLSKPTKTVSNQQSKPAAEEKPVVEDVAEVTESESDAAQPVGSQPATDQTSADEVALAEEEVLLEDTPPLEPSVAGDDVPLEEQTEEATEQQVRKKLPARYASAGTTRPGSSQSPMEAFRVPVPQTPPQLVDIPAKVRRYAQKLVTRYDLDGNGTLEPVEWLQMRGDPRNDDLNGDEMLTAEELAIRIAVYGHRRLIRLMPDRRVNEPLALNESTSDASSVGQASTAEEDAARIEAERERLIRARQFYVRSSRLPSGLPEWFVEGDSNGDAQMSMAEFSAKWSSSELDQFDLYDHNRDGMITAKECARGELARQQAENAEAAAQAASNEPAPEPLR